MTHEKRNCVYLYTILLNVAVCDGRRRDFRRQIRYTENMQEL